VPNFLEKEYFQTIRQMARILSAPEDRFWNLWTTGFNERALGILPNLDSQIVSVCQMLGIRAEREKIERAAQIRYDYEKLAMVPLSDAITVLSTLKLKNYKIGLITDCSSEATIIWNDTPLAAYFDVTIFSCLVGVKKPDPRIYQLALKQLAIEPGLCIYVGDGSNRELTGALQVGMEAVQLRMPGGDNSGNYRVDTEDWQGKRISSLTDVLAFLG
jgi:putative hydrolase of the HAD superfamily